MGSSGDSSLSGLSSSSSFTMVVLDTSVISTPESAGRMAFNNMAMTVPMQYPVDKKMDKPFRRPSMTSEQSEHLQKLAVFCEARISWKAKGQTVTPTPTAKLKAMMNLIRRECKSRELAKEIPLTKTLANKKIVIPPKTASGIEVIIPAILPKTPKKMSQHPQAYPARRLAHLVKAMTPLFWEKVVLGMVVKKPDNKLLMASDVKPPWRDSLYSSVSVSSMDTS
mmetsp:Transcript_15351/g.31689  ORF Transcript_15351/g.31689 Transcript_15351/m.31689 type:complete len:224 (+) Transcript_15351:257-928(+)